MPMLTQIKTKVNNFCLSRPVFLLRNEVFIIIENQITVQPFKLFSKELITFSTDDIKSCETRTELYTQDGSEHDRSYGYLNKGYKLDHYKKQTV